VAYATISLRPLPPFLQTEWLREDILITMPLTLDVVKNVGSGQWR
jgi:hypothetical protein